MNQGFNYVDVVGDGCKGWLNLFHNDDIVCLVRVGVIANEIRNTTPRRGESTMSTCNHKYSTNTGRGGKPEFKPMNGLMVNHVWCIHCGERTWLTESQLLLSGTTQRPVAPPKPPVNPVA
jgi:hypothetical protein